MEEKRSDSNIVKSSIFDLLRSEHPEYFSGTFCERLLAAHYYMKSSFSSTLHLGYPYSCSKTCLFVVQFALNEELNDRRVHEESEAPPKIDFIN